jgi:protein required for attachment to host cells
MKRKLIIVADLGLLKAYKADFPAEQSPRLEQLDEVVLEDAHTRVIDKLTDLAGRHIAPAQKKGSAPLADDHNMKLEYRRRLVRQIAGHIERLVGRAGEDGCWLAVQKEVNHQILKELSPSAREHIKKNLALDLTKVEPKEVLNQFLNASFY